MAVHPRPCDDAHSHADNWVIHRIQMPPYVRKDCKWCGWCIGGLSRSIVSLPNVATKQEGPRGVSALSGVSMRQNCEPLRPLLNTSRLPHWEFTPPKWLPVQSVARHEQYEAPVFCWPHRLCSRGRRAPALSEYLGMLIKGIPQYEYAPSDITVPNLGPCKDSTTLERQPQTRYRLN
jgi:hypothetical protein